MVFPSWFHDIKEYLANLQDYLSYLERQKDEIEEKLEDANQVEKTESFEDNINFLKELCSFK